MLTIQSATSSSLKGLGHRSACFSQTAVICCGASHLVFWSFAHTDETAAPINFLCLPLLPHPPRCFPTASPCGSEMQPAAVKQGTGPPIGMPCSVYSCVAMCVHWIVQKKGKKKKKEKSAVSLCCCQPCTCLS